MDFSQNLRGGSAAIGSMIFGGGASARPSARNALRCLASQRTINNHAADKTNIKQTNTVIVI